MQMQSEIVEMDSKANMLIGMKSNDEEWMLNYTKLVQTIPNYSITRKPKEKRLIKDKISSTGTKHGHEIDIHSLIHEFTK